MSRYVVRVTETRTYDVEAGSADQARSFVLGDDPVAPVLAVERGVVEVVSADSEDDSASSAPRPQDRPPSESADELTISLVQRLL